MDENPQDSIKDEAGRFPAHMLMIRDIFSFSFAEAANLSLSFNSNAELFEIMAKISKFIRNSDLDPEDAESIIKMMDDEMEVIAFSQTARRSVIAL